MHMNHIANTHKYDDILYLPHHTSKQHPRMSNQERAAQFSPFAALTGYDAAIKETARVTQTQMELDEDEKELLNHQMQFLLENISLHPRIAITYYVPDTRKAGGTYCTVTGNIKKFDLYEKFIVLQDELRINIKDIVKLDGDLFNNMEELYY